MSTAVFGAPEFKARSGRTVKPQADGSVRFELAYGYLDRNTAMDAEEFFQAKRDADLGRWRHPRDPHFVVYVVPEDMVFVIDERDGRSITAQRRDVGEFEPRGPLRGHFKAAWDYFEAHPESKPWEDAKPGEVWLLTVSGHEQPCHFSEGEWWTMFRVSGSITGEHISAGRRVWPEDAS